MSSTPRTASAGARLRPALVLAVALVIPMLALAACGKGDRPPLDNTSNGGADCLDGRCAPGLVPCENEGQRRACGTVHSKVGDQVSCLYGTQACVSGYWSACVGSPDGVKLQSLVKTGLKTQGLGSVSACAQACDPFCQQITDDLSEGIEAGGAGSGGYAVSDAGITIGEGLTYDGATDADLSTLADGAALSPDASFIFHVLKPGETAEDPIVFIDAKLRTTDIYFMVDHTSSMSEEADALTSALNDPTDKGIIQGIKSALGPLATFGFGRFVEYNATPYGFAGQANFPYQHILTIQPNPGPAQVATDWARSEGFPTIDLGGGLIIRDSSHAGGDIPESTVSALWSAMTGKGLYRSGNTTPTYGSTVFWGDPRSFWTGSPLAQDVAYASQAYAPDVPTTAGGLVPCPVDSSAPSTHNYGYPCWRQNSTPIFIVVTDAPSHNGPNGWYSYVQVPGNGSDTGAGIQGATPFPAATPLGPSVATPGATFATALTLPADSTGAPASALYYGTVPLRASGSSVGGGVYSLPTLPDNSALQVSQRSSLRDCGSGGYTVCNPLVTTLIEDIGLIQRAVAPQVQDRLSDQQAINTTTIDSLSDASAVVVAVSALYDAGPVNDVPRYVDGQAQLTAVPGYVGDGRAPPADYYSLYDATALPSAFVALSDASVPIATGTYSSLRLDAAVAARDAQTSLVMDSGIYSQDVDSSLRDANIDRPAVVSQLTSDAASANAILAFGTLFDGGVTIPDAAVDANVAVSAQLTDGGEVPAILDGGGFDANIGPVSSLWDFEAVFDGGPIDRYYDAAPWIDAGPISQLGTATQAIADSGVDFYNDASALQYDASALYGSFVAARDAGTRDIFFDGGIVAPTVSSLYGLVDAAVNTYDTLDGSIDAASTVTALTYRDAQSTATQDIYTGETDALAPISALDASTPYLTSQARPSTTPYTALTDERDASVTTSTTCTTTTPNATGTTNASYGSATQAYIVPGTPSAWSGSSGTGYTIPNAAGAGIQAAGTVTVPAGQAVFLTFTATLVSQGHNATLYARVGSMPTTSTYTVGPITVGDGDLGPKNTAVIYAPPSSSITVHLGVTKNNGDAVRPRVNIQTNFQTGSCGGGTNAIAGSIAYLDMNRCVTCAGGATWNSGSNCCSVTTTSAPTCDSGYTLISGKCYLVTCGGGTAYDSGTQTCCPSGNTRISGACYAPNNCPTDYAVNSTQCTPTSNCGASTGKIDYGSACWSVYCNPSHDGTTWSYAAGSPPTCNPLAQCPGKYGPYSKTSGGAQKCWTVGTCTADWVRDPVSIPGNTGHICRQPACASGQIAISSNPLVGPGCYTVGTSGNECVAGTTPGTVATVSYTYTGTSSSPNYACVPSTSNPCPTGRKYYTKDGTTYKCWNDGGCVGTRSGADGNGSPATNWHMCMPTGYQTSGAVGCPTGWSTKVGSTCYQSSGCTSANPAVAPWQPGITFSPSGNTCVPPANSCPTGRIAHNKGGGMQCWSEATCNTAGSEVLGSGANRHLCVNTACDPYYTYVASPGGGKTAGQCWANYTCDPTFNTQLLAGTPAANYTNTSTRTLQTSVGGVTLPTASPDKRYYIASGGGTNNEAMCRATTECGSKTVWDKTAGNATGAARQCYNVGTCASPKYQGSGTTAHICFDAPCPSGQTAVTNNGLKPNGCYNTAGITDAANCNVITVAGYTFRASAGENFDLQAAVACPASAASCSTANAYSCAPVTGLSAGQLATSGGTAGCFSGRVLSNKGAGPNRCWIANSCSIYTTPVNYTQDGTSPWLCNPAGCDAAHTYYSSVSPLTVGGVTRNNGCYQRNTNCTTGTGYVTAITGSWSANDGSNYTCTPNPNPACPSGYVMSGGRCYLNEYCPPNTTGVPFTNGAGNRVCQGITCNTATSYDCTSGGVPSCCANSCPANGNELTWAYQSGGAANVANSKCVATMACGGGRISYDIGDGLGTRCWSSATCSGSGAGGTSTQAYACTPSICATGRTLMGTQTIDVTTKEATDNTKLIGWWRGEATSTTTAAYQSVINSLGGTRTGDSRFIEDGYTAAGYEFADKSAGCVAPNYCAPNQNTYISVADNALLDDLSPFSVSVWIYLYSDTQTSTIISKGNSTDGWGLELLNGTIRWRVRSTYSTATSSALAKNTWYHVIASWSGSAFDISVRDAANMASEFTIASGSMTLETPPSNSSPLRIGANLDNTGKFWGRMDELALFERTVPYYDTALISAVNSTTTGVYGHVQCYAVGCPATANEWAYTGTGATPVAPDLRYTCEPDLACSGGRIPVDDNNDGTDDHCYTEACPASWTMDATAHTCTQDKCRNGAITVEGALTTTYGVPAGCYVNTSCPVTAQGIQWTAAANYQCTPSNNGCPSTAYAGGTATYVRAGSAAGVADACYINQNCGADSTTSGSPGVAPTYECTRSTCVSPTVLDPYNPTVCRTPTSCGPAGAPVGSTWTLTPGTDPTNPYLCTPNPTNICGTTGRVRFNTGGGDQCWSVGTCAAGDTGGTAGDGYVCKPKCPGTDVKVGAQCYTNQNCPSNGNGVTWTRDSSQMCNPSQGCYDGYRRYPDDGTGLCYYDQGCQAGYVYEPGVGAMGVCRGCTGGRTLYNNQCYDESCPANADGITWTNSGAGGAPPHMCNPSFPTASRCPNPKVEVAGQCWYEGCPTDWTLNTSTHRCIAPACSGGRQIINGACWTLNTCPSGWTSTDAPTYTCSKNTCTPETVPWNPLSAGTAPCDSGFTCTGPDGSAVCQRAPTCAQDCSITADRECENPSPTPGYPTPSIQCRTLQIDGSTCTSTSASGDGTLSSDVMFRFTVPPGLPNSRYYYHFALLRRDSAGHTSDPDAFLYIKPAQGVDAANSGNANGRVLDCNRDHNRSIGVTVTGEANRWMRSAIDSYLTPGDYYLVIDHLAAAGNSAAYDYVLQVGGFDDDSAPTAVAAPSYKQLVSELTTSQARIIGVDSSGVACRQSTATPTSAQYETRDFLEKLAYDTGSIDNTDPMNPQPFVVSIRTDATDCDPAATSDNGLGAQVINAAKRLGDTLQQDIVVRAQLPNQVVTPGFIPPVSVSQFIESVTAISTAQTQDYCGRPTAVPVVPDVGTDILAGYQKFNVCRPGVTANFNVKFKMPTTIPVQKYDQYFRFDLVILAGVGEVGRFPVVLKLPGTNVSADYDRVYDLSEVCPPTTRLKLVSFTWATTTPPPYNALNPTYRGSNVEFYASYADTVAGLSTAPEHYLETAQVSPLPPQGPTDIGNVSMPQKLGTDFVKHLKIRSRMNPSEDGDKPTITNWQLVFSCPPSE